MKKKDNTKRIKINLLVLIFSSFLLLLIIIQGARISLVDEIDGTNIKKFAMGRNIKETTLLIVVLY